MGDQIVSIQTSAPVSAAPVDQARQSSVSNWFYYLGQGITDSLDGRVYAPVAASGASVGVTAGQNGVGVTISPVFIMLGVLAWMAMKRG